MAGVGGQGVLLASNVLGNAGLEEGKEIVLSELHGMAQRGGSVVATLRIGEGVTSPLIEKGGADVLLGFEPVETYRYLAFAHRGTYIIMNTTPILPVQVSMGLEKYPDLSLLHDAIDEISDRLFPIDANDLAEKAGNRLAASSVLIGAITGLKDFPISREAVERALLRRVPARYADANQKAFAIGYEKMKSMLPGSKYQNEETQ